MIPLSSATPATEETIVLAPPSNLTVINNRDSLLLPCVSSGPTLPSFSRLDVMGERTQFGLEISTVTESEGGVYTCTVGGVSVNTTVTVTPGIVHSLLLFPYVTLLYDSNSLFFRSVSTSKCSAT